MKPLADAITVLLVLFEGMDCPDDVEVINKGFVRAWGVDNPRKALNRSVANLRRHRPDAFYKLHLWLERPEVLNKAKRGGAYWAWKIWKQASIAIHRGVPAHRAFGMNEAGAPRSQCFTYTEEAAIWATHCHKNRGYTKIGGVLDAEALFGVSRREIEKACKRFSSTLSNEDLRIAACHTLAKYRIDHAESSSVMSLQTGD